MRAPAGRRGSGPGAAALLGFAGCAFHAGVAPSDSSVPADIVDDVDVPADCRELHQADPSKSTGSYTIDPDGAGGEAPLTVDCDMDTDGGGWTIVFVAGANVTTIPVAYSTASPRLLTDATQALVAYRDSSRAAASDHALIDLPGAWQAAAPFNAAGTDLPTMASIDGAAPVSVTLRYGYGSFSNRCDDGWIGSETWGRICVVGTRAPFYSGFAVPNSDTCSNSLGLWDAAPCTPDRRFSIAVR